VLEVTEKGFTPMVLAVQGSVTRYTADFASGRWQQPGETTADGGTTWATTFEMSLERVARAPSASPPPQRWAA
jgi:hypothetical protein